jgi:hypothetical protein
MSEANDAVGTILDSWTLQATAGFTGCVSANLDKTLTDPGLISLVIAGLHRVLAKLPADGLVNAADPWLIERAERVTDGGRWRCPSASAPWVIEVGKALIDLIQGVLPATPDDFWFIDGLGRRKLPRIRQDVKPA